MADVTLAWWYCLDCGEKNPMEVHIRSHWTSAHREADSTELPTNGLDYALGGQLLLLQKRRAAWIDERAEMFSNEMHERFGAEDFVAEAEIRDA